MGRAKKAPLPNGPETEADKENKGAGKAAKEIRTYAVANAVTTLGRAIINQHYPELKHQQIEFVFTSRAFEVGGDPIICKPSKISGLAAWFAAGGNEGEVTPFFVIVVSQTHWDNMPQKAREAFLDGALAQFGVSEKGALRMLKPDISESSAVLARHGLYSKKLKDQAGLIKQALEQPALELAS